MHLNLFRMKSNKSKKHFSRRFYASKNQGDCDAEELWLMVADTDHGPGYCQFEKGLKLPAFIYSSGMQAQGGKGGLFQN